MKIQKITEFFFLLSLFSLPFYFWKFSFFSVPTNVLELLATASVFLFVLDRKHAVLSGWKKNLDPLSLPVLLLFLGLLSSFLFSNWSLSGLGILKGWFLIPFLFALSLPSVLNSSEKITRAIKTIFLSVFLVALVSLAHKIAGVVTYDQRLSAFYLSPNHLAMFLAPGFFLAHYLISEEKRFFRKALLGLSAFLILTAFYFTFSYSAWLAVFFSFIFLLLLKKISWKKTYLLFFGASFLICLFFFFQQNNPKLNSLLDSRSSLSSRTMIWRSSLRIIRDNPVLGIGPGNFQTSYLDYQQYFPPYLEWAVPQPHNLYLAFYLQTGLVGLIGFLLLCFKWFSLGLTQKNTTFSVVSLGILFYVLLHGLVDTPYWKNDLAYFFWIILFLTVAFSNRPDHNQRSSR